MKTRTQTWIPFLWIIPMTLAAQTAGDVFPLREDAAASGLGINLPLVARLIGAGATLYTSSLDVANNTSTATQVDFYLDGIDIASGASISKVGSISSSG